MPNKYIAELFLNIINELARHNLINQEAWQQDVDKLQNCIAHIEAVESAQRDEDTNKTLAEGES